MKKILKKTLDIILLPFTVVTVLFAGMAIISNFLFTPKLFQKFSGLFPQLFSKKLFIILLLILILIAGGIFAWQYFGAPAEITNWETYKNEDIGFEVKYPPNLREEWKLSEESFTLHEDWGEQIGKRLLLFSTTDSDKVYGFGFSTYSNPNNLTLREFSQKLMDWNKLGCELKTTEDILFGEEQTSGVKFTFHDCNNARVPDEIISRVLTKENNNVIEISGIGSLSNSRFIKQFDLILSTFKSFIEKEKVGEEATDWQTYRNEEYRFEIKYPASMNIYYEGTEFLKQPLRVDFGDFEVIVWDNPGRWSIEDYFLDDFGCTHNKPMCEYFGQGYSLKGINIGSRTGWTTNVGVKSQFFVVLFNSEFFLEFLNKWPTDTEKTEIFDQVLSTFKFLE